MDEYGYEIAQKLLPSSDFITIGLCAPVGKFNETALDGLICRFRFNRLHTYISVGFLV
jgi:hypothetical protein